MAAEAAFQLGHFSAAEERMRALIHRQPSLQRGYLAFGDYLNGRGRKCEARAVWEEGYERTRDAELESRRAAR